ncbi:MAG: SMC-Scp complex subunit ScpB [Phycisphaerales bacterium]|nr:SMC-Scp complex subunit ScpB [Phycisphaerales bacterium]
MTALPLTPDSEDAAPTPAAGTESTPCANEPLAARLEAVLLAAERPLSEARLASILVLRDEDAKPKSIVAAIESLNAAYAESGRTFRIEHLAGGWRMLTMASYGPVIARLRGERQQAKLTQAALETLAIIAYRQPMLRADLEAIRGVACGEVLRGLMERRLVRIVGRAEEPGRPMLYGTTKEFLQVFGLASVDDLPPVGELTKGGAGTA